MVDRLVVVIEDEVDFRGVFIFDDVDVMLVFLFILFMFMLLLFVFYVIVLLNDLFFCR